MSGTLLLRDAVLAALRADTALMALVNGVDDDAVPRTAAPALLLADPSASDWGARGVQGLAVRLPFVLTDRSDRIDRLSDAAGRIEAVMTSLPAAIGTWRIGSVRLDRTRSARGADGHWSLFIDYLARLSRLN